MKVFSHVVGSFMGLERAEIVTDRIMKVLNFLTTS